MKNYDTKPKKKKKEPHKFMQLLTTKKVKSVMKSTPKKKNFDSIEVIVWVLLLTNLRK